MQEDGTRPLWTCPSCGARFTTANQWHSCGRFDLDRLLAKGSRTVGRLYARFVELVQACGPVTILPQKSRIAFQVRMRFAAVTPQRSSLRGHLVLARVVRSDCFDSVESLGPRSHVHVFRLRSEEQFTPEFGALVREAYEVGRQAQRRMERR